MSNQIKSIVLPAEAAIRSHGVPCGTPQPYVTGGLFEADGIVYRRDGSVITIGSDSFRCDGYSMARFLFDQLTVALL